MTIKSKNHYGKTPPSYICGIILKNLPLIIEAAVRMAIEGRSASTGRKPKWLESSSDIRFLGVRGKDETILQFEAPKLGDAAKELYTQKVIWETKPDPNWTGFDLIAETIGDISKEQMDSDRFDSKLLNRLTPFQHALGKNVSEIDITGSRGLRHRAIMNSKMIQAAKKLASSTPAPQRTRLAGRLDMIRASTSSFGIRLEDGQEVLGTIKDDNFMKLPELVDKNIVILGTAIFKPSGKVLRIDADEIKPASGNFSLWSKVPAPQTNKLDKYKLRKKQNANSGLAAIIGKWPGNETEEEIAEALEKVS